MTAEEVLARVLEAGGKVIRDPASPRLLVPAALKPLVAEHKSELRALILSTASAGSDGMTSVRAEYRDTLHRWWALIAGLAEDRSEATRLHQEVLRLIDEVGEPSATELRRDWARAWYQETGACPTCGERGPYHDADGGEDA